MNDEKYVFFQDLREKKTTGYSARKQRSHCGKGGRVKLPSDYKTKKELQKMNGECKSYRLNEPMKWAEFNALPDDIKVMYIAAIREKYNAPNTAIANMMGISKGSVSLVTKKLGIAPLTRGKHTWDKTGFEKWCSSQEDSSVNMPVDDVEKPEEIAPYEPVMLPAKEEPKTVLCAIPDNGSMTFEGKIEDILNTLGVLLAGAKVHIGIQWDLMEEEHG